MPDDEGKLGRWLWQKGGRTRPVARGRGRAMARGGRPASRTMRRGGRMRRR